MEINSDLISINLSTNIGFAIAGGVFDIHLKRNHELPCTFTKYYITAFDYQTELLFPLYMGERILIRYCEPLAFIRVKKIPKSKAGELSIEINLTIDKDENMNIIATEMHSKKNLPIEYNFLENFESKSYRMILDGIKYKEQDIECDKKIREFKLVIKSIREKYKDYTIREEINGFLNTLNKSKDEMNIELVNELLFDLYKRIIELNINVDLESIQKQLANNNNNNNNVRT